MLTNLYIKNYALFNECEIAFDKGLNILTGETGAGKSLLVGALGLLLGKRSDSSVIFYPDQKCIVEATFDFLSPKIQKQISAFDDFDYEGNRLIVRRELGSSGKTRVFINDTPISVQVLKEVMAILIDLHGQNESQLLLEPAKQLELLDEFTDTHPLLEEFKLEWEACKKIQSEIDILQKEEATAKQQFDYFSFLVQELSDANLQADEEEMLEQEIQVLQNATEIRDALHLSTEDLYNQDRSCYQILSECMHALGKVSEYDKQIAEAMEKLEEAKSGIKEVTFSLQNMLDVVEENPERIAFIEERLSMYFKLKKKYNAKTGEDLIRIHAEYSQQLDKFASIEGDIQALKAQLHEAQARLVEKGIKIEIQRKSGIPALESKVNMLLTEVGFKDARFVIGLSRSFAEGGSLEIEGRKVRPQATGFNKIEFLIQTNPGLAMGQLAQIASGGEISRVMLAIKTALADKSEFPVLIFDEIDTGISGEVAHKVGNVMHKLGNHFQILSITHLPPIAARGHQQYLIYKEVSHNITHSGVRRLTEPERIREIAKMIGGDTPTENTLRSAAELLGYEG